MRKRNLQNMEKEIAGVSEKKSLTPAFLFSGGSGGAFDTSMSGRSGTRFYAVSPGSGSSIGSLAYSTFRMIGVMMELTIIRRMTAVKKVS